MVFFRKRIRIQSERLVVLLLFALLPYSVFSQDDDGNSEEEIQAVVEISPEKIIVGQRFDLTIFADFSAYRNVKIIEPELPDGITLVSGPYKSAQTIRIGDVSDPQYIKKTRIFYKFKVNKPGLFHLGQFSLSDGETLLTTEPIMFPVLSYDERELNYPIFAKWNQIPYQIYIGETIPIILEMENLEELSFPERISMEPPAGGMFEKVNSVGEISVSTIAGNEVFIAPIESWLYTPTSSGFVTIPSATVQYGSISRSTGSKKIEVLNTPIEVEASGAIGNFVVNTVMENLPVRKGSTLILRIKVEGEGNLNYLRMPQPEFQGFSVIEKEELYHIKPSLAGYTGYREDVYRIIITDEEELSIIFNDWNWLNKESNLIETESMSNYHFQNNTFSEKDTTLSLREEFTLFGPDEILKYRDPIYNVSWYYLLMLPGIISVLTALIKRKHDMRLLGLSLVIVLLSSSAIGDNPDLKKLLENAQSFIKVKDEQSAINLYDEVLEISGNHGAVYYNKALLNYDLGHKDRVIFNLRKALIYKPGDETFLNLLGLVEMEYELDHQAIASAGVSPDLFFAFFILLFNLGALTVVFNIGKRKIELSILIIMIYFLAGGSTAVIFYTNYISKRETAVITSGGGELKKVPGLNGGSWLTLQEGTAVYIKSDSDDSLLIRTGYGLEGWLDKQFLLIVQEDL